MTCICVATHLGKRGNHGQVNNWMSLVIKGLPENHASPAESLPSPRQKPGWACLRSINPVLAASLSMLSLSHSHPSGSSLKVLCLGAHSDDIEIGCGGSVLTLLHEQDNVHVRSIVYRADGRRAHRARGEGTGF